MDLTKRKRERMVVKRRIQTKRSSKSKPNDREQVRRLQLQLLVEDDKENGRGEAPQLSASDALFLERLAAVHEAVNLPTSPDAVDSDDSENEEAASGEQFPDDDDDIEMIARLHNATPKTLGFIACAHETLKYMREKGGFAHDDPTFANMRNYLMDALAKLSRGPS